MQGKRLGCFLDTWRAGELSFGQGDLPVGHLYGDLQWTAGCTGLEENQIQSWPWRVLLWSERNKYKYINNRSVTILCSEG